MDIVTEMGYTLFMFKTGDYKKDVFMAAKASL